MNSKIEMLKIFLILSILISAIIPSISSDVSLSKNTIYVDDDADPSWYDATHVKTIQDGINNASSGDTIYVYSGTYYENIVVNKTISLTGEKTSSTLINGKGNTVIDIQYNEVLIDGFTIINQSGDWEWAVDFHQYDNIQLKNCIIRDSSSAVQLKSSSNNYIHNCSFQNLQYYGLYVNQPGGGKYSDDNTFSNCTFYNTSIGLFVMCDSGLPDACTFHRNKIMNNSFINCHNFGIYLWESWADSTSGIKDCVFYGNHFINNQKVVGFSSGDFENNTFYFNDFIMNDQDVYNEQCLWDNGTVGNYWDTYNGTDADFDGIGDTPHLVNGSTYDNYPLMNSTENLPIPFMTYVDDNFNKSTPGWQYNHFDVIQDGIDAVEENGSVYVYNGIYYENLAVNKTIDLIGEHRNNTIIDGDENGDVIYVSSDNVLVEGFHIQNGEVDFDFKGFNVLSNYTNIIGNIVTGNEYGIYLASSDNNCIYENVLQDNNYGIYLANSDNNTISNNVVQSNNIVGIYVGNSVINSVTDNVVEDNNGYGIYLYSSSTCIVEYNNVTSNICGIRLDGSTGYCNNNLIMNNKLSSNSDYGISLFYCDDNTVKNNSNITFSQIGIHLSNSNINNLSDNTLSYNYYGIHLADSDTNSIHNNTVVSNDALGLYFGYSHGNTVDHNLILNNSNYGIYLISSVNNILYDNYISNLNNWYDNGSNIWNISKTVGINIIGGSYLGGNYWSDYGGYDIDDDGIGDMLIPYGPGDFLPLTNIQLDVNQPLFDRGYRMMPGWDASQEFIPSFDYLSSIDVYVSKFGSPSGNVTVQICDGAAGGMVLSEMEITPGEVPSYPVYEWVTIDIEDVSVTPGEKYFIVLKDAQGADTHHCVQWGWCDSYPSGSGGPYDGGWFWFRKEFNPTWSPIRDWDYTFRTFGLN